jgi:hypothetical protein
MLDIVVMRSKDNFRHMHCAFVQAWSDHDGVSLFLHGVASLFLRGVASLFWQGVACLGVSVQSALSLSHGQVQHSLSWWYK